MKPPAVAEVRVFGRAARTRSFTGVTSCVWDERCDAELATLTLRPQTLTRVDPRPGSTSAAPPT